MFGSLPGLGYLSDDSSSIDASSIPADTSSEASSNQASDISATTVSYEPAAPMATIPPGTTIDPDDVRGLQTAINRFYGVPTNWVQLTVDGVVGAQTVSAVQAIRNWLPTTTTGPGGNGFDTSTIDALVGSIPTIASVSVNAADLSNALDWIATQAGFPAAGNPVTNAITNTFSSVQPAKTPSGLIAPSVAPSQLPRGPSRAAATTLLGLGIPNWVFYIAGGLLAAGIAMLVVRRIRRGRQIEGLEHFDEGDEDQS